MQIKTTVRYHLTPVREHWDLGQGLELKGREDCRRRVDFQHKIHWKNRKSKERQTTKQINRQKDFPEYDYDLVQSFSDGSAGEESAGNAGGTGDMVSELRRSPGEEHGNPLQCPFLGNPMNKGAYRATVHSVSKSWT